MTELPDSQSTKSSIVASCYTSVSLNHASSIGISVCFPCGQCGVPSFPTCHIHITLRKLKASYRNSKLESQVSVVKQNKMSAIDENSEGPIEVIQVLIALHPSFGAQELCGPLEVLSNAFHKLKDPGRSPCLSLMTYFTF